MLERLAISRKTKKDQCLKIRTLYENTCCSCKKVFQGFKRLAFCSNDISNLLIIFRKDHASLHEFSKRQRALLKRFNNGNDENCWKTLIVPLTTTWLETTSVNVRKLVEIGQSAAEPLSNVEGSETMHVASHVDEDIVQTTTSE